MPLAPPAVPVPFAALDAGVAPPAVPRVAPTPSVAPRTVPVPPSYAMRGVGASSRTTRGSGALRCT
jgi:hypothetical protein